MENPSHNLSSWMDPKVVSLVVKDKHDQATRVLKSMQVVESQGSCFIPVTSPASGLKNLWILCGHWCCVSHHHVLVYCLCFSIICVKAGRFPHLVGCLSFGSPETLWRDTQFSQVSSKIHFNSHICSHTLQWIVKPNTLSWPMSLCSKDKGKAELQMPKSLASLEGSPPHCKTCPAAFALSSTQNKSVIYSGSLNAWIKK